MILEGNISYFQKPLYLNYYYAWRVQRLDLLEAPIFGKQVRYPRGPVCSSIK